LRVRQLTIEQESHFHLVANGMQFGVDSLMKLPQSPDSLFAQLRFTTSP
jgi:hypothetical protein